MHRTKDGKYVAISAANQAVAMKLLHMIGGETLTGNPRYSSVAARAESVHEIYSLLDAWVGAHSLAEVLEAAAASDVVIGPIYETSDILANPHITARGNLIEIETRDGQSMTMPQAVPRLSTHPLPQHRAAPAKGADTQALIKEFGLLDATLPDREELSP
jgi:formyl-CoA transferase